MLEHLKARSANPTSAMPQRGHNGASGAKDGSGPLWVAQTTSLLKEVVNHA
jgi:hypothetical protein